MTSEEYKKLKRFKKEDHFLKTDRFAVNDIFEAYTMDEKIKYIKIVAAFDNLFFDLLECTSEGGKVPFPYKRNFTKHSEIMTRLEENDWRLFKRHE